MHRSNLLTRYYKIECVNHALSTKSVLQSQSLQEIPLVRYCSQEREVIELLLLSDHKLNCEPSY